MMYFLITIIIFSPLLGSLILLFKNDKSNLSTAIIGNISIGISMILSLFLLISYLFDPTPIENFTLFKWFSSNKFTFEFGLLVDSLSVVMSFIVTFVSFFIHIYSIGYMEKDLGFNRFFIYTNFFTFSMLLIVFSNNFFQLFVGWELVGLSSYLLIGFWHEKISAVNANLKAFIVNRIGDIGLLLGVILIFVSTKSLDYNNLFLSLSALSEKNITILNYSFEAIPLIALLLFIGASAKSAQIPLHFWLPDSMEGPTPISALIHAATMVTAGIFMIVRLSPLYNESGYVLDLILIIGTSTAFLMGLVALVQNDIKRIIAYSTISQLGYMTAALGASYYSFAIYHLLTHAFFKALLFLCAGSIILKCHHEQDITKMGGLRKIMPYTFFAYLIAGISLMGVPFTSGFYSKDLIIDIFKNNGNSFIYYFLIAGVFITTLYTSKIFFKVFFGDNKLKIEDSTELEHKDVILMPLIALAIPSMFIGLALFDSMLFNNYFAGSTSDFNITSNFYNNYIISAFSFTVHAFTSLSFFVLVIGVITSYLIYYKEIDLSKIFEGKLSLIKKILESEYGFINLSNNYIPLYFKKIANILWIKSDVNIIDNLIVNGIANQIKKISTRIRLIQTGYIYHYAFTMIIGLMLFLLVFFNF